MYGGYFGQYDKQDFSIDEAVLEFADQVGTGKNTFQSQHLKMWHEVLTHGVNPKEFLKELSLLLE